MGLNYEVVIQEELVSAYQREWLWHITVIPCPLMHGLPDMYTISPRACGPWASGVHIYIRQTTHVHGITMTYSHTDGYNDQLS